MAANSVGGMFGLFFTGEAQITHFQQVIDNCDGARFKRFYHGMLDEGVYLAPSAFEAGFVSSAHSEADLDATVASARKLLATL